MIGEGGPVKQSRLTANHGVMSNPCHTSCKEWPVLQTRWLVTGPITAPPALDVAAVDW